MPDRPRLCQRCLLTHLSSWHMRTVRSPGPDGPRSAARPGQETGPVACAKMSFGRDGVFLSHCTTDCSGFLTGQYVALVRTVRPLWADSPPMLFKLVSALLFHIDRFQTVWPGWTDCRSLTFLTTLTCFKRSLYLLLVRWTVLPWGADHPRVRKTCASCT
jgi:hypothetical protein